MIVRGVENITFRRKALRQMKGSCQYQGCLVQVGNGIELEAVGLQFEPYRWRPCGVTWDSSRTVVVIKLRRTSALSQLATFREIIRRLRLTF